ncbi:hypothetical protein RRG08_062159, partial [Elysia crispata]
MTGSLSEDGVYLTNHFNRSSRFVARQSQKSQNSHKSHKSHKTVSKVTKQSQTSHVSAIRKSGSSEGGAGARCTSSEPGLPSSRAHPIFISIGNIISSTNICVIKIVAFTSTIISFEFTSGTSIFSLLSYRFYEMDAICRVLELTSRTLTGMHLHFPKTVRFFLVFEHQVRFFLAFEHQVRFFLVFEHQVGFFLVFEHQVGFFLVFEHQVSFLVFEHQVGFFLVFEHQVGFFLVFEHQVSFFLVFEHQ